MRDGCASDLPAQGDYSEVASGVNDVPHGMRAETFVADFAD
jgi:hypothetical protein